MYIHSPLYSIKFISIHPALYSNLILSNLSLSIYIGFSENMVSNSNGIKQYFPSLNGHAWGVYPISRHSQLDISGHLSRYNPLYAHYTNPYNLIFPECVAGVPVYNLGVWGLDPCSPPVARRVVVASLIPCL